MTAFLQVWVSSVYSVHVYYAIYKTSQNIYLMYELVR